MPILGAFMSLVGSVFFLLAAIGLLRMPDAFNRMQAGTKATTLGSILFLAGIGVMKPDYLGRALLLALFIQFQYLFSVKINTSLFKSFFYILWILANKFYVEHVINRKTALINLADRYSKSKKI